MNSSYEFHEGTVPLLVSVPHDGRQLPADIQNDMTTAGIAIPDTDWHVAELYAFSRSLGASQIVAVNSRYVVDLNRSADDEILYEGQLATGLCPVNTFAGEPIYKTSVAVDAITRDLRVAKFWQPYHDKLATELRRLRDKYGYALLWDAHSIESYVPTLFDGELPQLNVGTYDDRSCSQELSENFIDVARRSGYSMAVNARFKGGYITRAYGRPTENVHAVQLEIAQRCYMDEESRDYNADNATKLQTTLSGMLQAFIDTARQHYRC